MAFRTPSVRVYQELISTTASLTTPFFQLCIVGPAYQVEEQTAVADYVLSAEDYVGTYPNQTLGSTVDTDSVEILLSDVYVKVWPVTTNVLFGNVTVDNETPVTTITGTDALELSEASIEVGDYIDITYTTDEETMTYSSSIQTVSDDGKEITLTRNIVSPDEGAIVTAVVKRPTKEDTTLDPQYLKATTENFTITQGAEVSTNVLDTVAVIVSASVKLSYRALRADIANDFLTITSQSVAEAQLGAVNIKNPLSVACNIVANVMSDMDYKILPISSDDANGYTKALDILSTSEQIYVIVPLTDDSGVVSSYASHCTAMSEPEKCKWRITYCSLPAPTTKVMIEINDGQLVPGTSEDNCYIKDTANGMFISNNARVTDFLDMYNDKNEYQYSLQLLEVLNENVASFSTVKWERTGEGYVETEDVLEVTGTETVKYEIVRVLDTQGVADAIGEMAASYSNKRLRLVMPDTIMIDVNSVTESVSGYYLCVALGAMRAGYPPHQGFSTIGISGIKRILNANKVFTDDQLADMAGEGVFWVVQDEPEDLPYVLYQTTTDTTQLETAEDSCVAVVDYASKYYRDNLKDVLGKYNVNTISVNYCKTIINACSDAMTGTSYQYIGPILISAYLVSIETEGDTIKPTIRIEIPYPVNAVDVYLQI